MARPTKREQTNRKIAAAMTKLDAITVKKLEEAFAMDCTVGEACLYAGISRTTYYAWIKDNPELANRFEELRETPVLKARSTIIKGLDNVGTSQWYIERKRKNEFASRQEHTGADGQPLQELTTVVKEIIKRK
jgi:hypothetical protein